MEWIVGLLLVGMLVMIELLRALSANVIALSELVHVLSDRVANLAGDDPEPDEPGAVEENVVELPRKHRAA